MERPSHINFRTSHPFSHRLVVFGLAASLQLAFLWGLTHGMVGHAVGAIVDLVYVPTDEPVKPQTPPPDPTIKDVDRIKIEKPIFEYKQDQSDRQVTATAEPVAPRQPDTAAAGPDRAAVAIASTHTIPPYPMLAQRLGAEGRVTLRLTVLTDGRVGRAEIVTSSGRGDLDEVAQEWIVTHWTYKPALDHGQPAVSQTLANVIFSLRNER